MKTQKLSDFMNIDNFISNITEKLKEKHKVYPLIKVGNLKVKSKKEYYTIEDIESVLKYFLNQ